MLDFFKRLLTILGRMFSLEYLFRAIKMPSAILLVLVNLIPIVGILFWGWNPYDIIFLYWVENIVIGGFNFFRIFLAQGRVTTVEGFITKNEGEIMNSGIEQVDDTSELNNFTQASSFLRGKFLAFFFIIHYGLFTLVHGAFIMFLFAPKSSFISEKDYLGIVIFFLALVISHGFSFFYNYIYKKEYLHRSPQQQTMEPYKRIFPIHITIIFGAMIASVLPQMVVILFVLLKIFFDLGGHMGSHQNVTDVNRFEGSNV